MIRKSGPTHIREESFGYIAIQLGHLIVRRATAALAPLDLKPREYDAMEAIAKCGGLSQQDLSRELGVVAPRMVALVDGMQKKGLVERQVSPEDRRRNVVTLTVDGEQLLDHARRVAMALESEMFGKVTPREHNRLATLVRHVASLPDLDA